MVLRCGLHAGAHADVLVGIGVLQAATIQQGAQQFAKGAFRVWIVQARNKCLGYPLGRVVCTFNPPWDFVSIPPLLVVRTLLIALRKHRRQKPLRQLLLCGGFVGRTQLLARFATLRLPEISLRRTANGVPPSVGGSATLPITLCST